MWKLINEIQNKTNKNDTKIIENGRLFIVTETDDRLNERFLKGHLY